MTHIHVESWVKQSKQDYYMMFVKAWIPFNAWYKRECKLAALPKTTDKACIQYLCDNSNPFKTKIISLLSNNDKEAKRFRNELAELHLALGRHIIPDPATPLNFSTMVPGITSPSFIEKDFRAYHYKVERKPVGNSYKYEIRVEDKETHAPKYTKTIDKWDETLITTDANYLALKSPECRTKILEYFNQVNPNLPLDIVKPVDILPNGSKKKPAHSIEISKDDDIYFSDQGDCVAKVLIHLLYKLRCEIFHGSLDPTQSNMEIYEHAYFIQYQLIKELV